MFEDSTLTKRNFLKFYGLVSTRAFGSDLPTATLVPMADNFNHRNNHCCWGLVNKKLHLEGDPASEYFMEGRFMEDISAIYDKCPKAEKTIKNSETPDLL